MSASTRNCVSSVRRLSGRPNEELVFVALPAGAAYSAWNYTETVQQSAVRRQSILKSPSEEALKDMDKEQSR